MLFEDWVRTGGELNIGDYGYGGDLVTYDGGLDQCVGTVNEEKLYT